MPPVKVKTATRTKRKKSAAKRLEYIEYKNADRALAIALYYGFAPLAEPFTITREDRERVERFGDDEEKSKGSHYLLFSAPEKAALMRLYHERKWFERPQPLALFTELAPGDAKRKGEMRRIGLDLLGAEGSIAEAILIQTARTILADEGYADIVVEINSVGDRDCMNRFVRELLAFYRKSIADLPAPCRALLRKNPVALLECTHERCRTLSENAPKSIAFLSEGSRAHFKEVLEYLEELAVPYRMNQTLIGSRALATETVFELRDTADEKTRALLGVGMRYNSLARRLGEKRDIPSAGVILQLPDRGRNGARRVRVRKPRFLFLQIGAEAKRKSLQVIELLRKEDIALQHALAREKLLSQMGDAETKLPYTLIMGQREALEEAVIVRENATRAQETIKIAELPQYLKKLKLV